MTELPEESVTFTPPEELLGLFALPLAHGISGMPRRATVDLTVKASAVDIGGNDRGGQGLRPRQLRA
jgi:hypothetical protein